MYDGMETPGLLGAITFEHTLVVAHNTRVVTIIAFRGVLVTVELTLQQFGVGIVSKGGAKHGYCYQQGRQEEELVHRD
ncbi:hypothetical protein PoB_007569100 [Plakobranchus ocellatus]|uniref:Uncharacterized protein n=1 Tax=Plakobranchus ocellatus TaxID=259542 RepID=A0AAV4DZB2_9GAST|nr:hypothetical protein PoB_007569100 [Plakobranchus ocellatus]